MAVVAHPTAARILGGSVLVAMVDQHTPTAARILGVAVLVAVAQTTASTASKRCSAIPIVRLLPSSSVWRRRAKGFLLRYDHRARRRRASLLVHLLLPLLPLRLVVEPY